MKQAADVLRLEKETAEKLAAKAFAKSYLADLVPSVFNNLRENGYFYDPVERDVETGFLPWLMAETSQELDKEVLARVVLDNLIREVVVKRHAEYEQLTALLAQQEEDALLKREESTLLPPIETEPTTEVNPAEAEATQQQADGDTAADEQVDASKEFDEVNILNFIFNLININIV
jgi:hypothetical protein